MRCRRWQVVTIACVSACVASCAARAVPPLPVTLAHPNFMYPSVAVTQFSADSAALVDRGWRYLQNDDVANAALEFQQALRREPALYPARVGVAYTALARGDHELALREFGDALGGAPTYVPALVGRGQTLLMLDRQLAALESFEAALAVDPSLADIRGTVDVLRFRTLQEVIGAARTAVEDGRFADARAAYGRAITTSPDSAFLHRELGLLERRSGNRAAALDSLRRAVDLDPDDAASLVQIGELLEQEQDRAGALVAYRRASAIAPSNDLNAKVAALAEPAAATGLPGEFEAIARSTAIGRGDLAALIGVRLAAALESASTTDVVMTDTVGHWAAPWMSQVARAGVLVPFANHEFQPDLRITRADLAHAGSRIVALLAAERPGLRPYLTARPQIADMAAGHLSYPDASVTVAAGVTPLVAGGRFEATRPVSGAEAIEAVARLQVLAAAAR